MNDFAFLNSLLLLNEVDARGYISATALCSHQYKLLRLLLSAAAISAIIVGSEGCQGPI